MTRKTINTIETGRLGFPLPTPEQARRLRLASSPVTGGQPVQNVASQWMPTDNVRVIEIVSWIAPHAETLHHTS